MKRTIIWLLLITFLLAGCDLPEKGETAPPVTTTPTAHTEGGDGKVDLSTLENKVQILCYNIYYQDVERRAENIQDLIVKNDPDVLMLQEVCLDWIVHLQSFMDKNGYSYYGYGRYGGEMSSEEQKKGDQYVPILWKTEKYDLIESGHFWLSSTPDVFSSDWADGTKSDFPRCVNWVILKDKVTGGEFVALNIHTDPESDRVRSNSCDLVVQKLEAIRDGRPAVLGGDWNMGLTDTGYRIITSGGYQDVRVKAETTDLGGSFNAWGDREEGDLAYGDHIFMSEGMGAELFDVVDDNYDGEHISDHNPLLAVLYY